jgi:serine/threonine-protein kinase
MEAESARLGRYKLVERLAAGGMAEVYLARLTGDQGLEKTVVIKTILPQYTDDPALRKMMLDEARIGFELRHQSIAQVLDVGREGDTLFIAMEYIDGLDLSRAEKVSAHLGEPIDPMLVTHIGVQVLRALGYAHRRTGDDGAPMNIVHRDISPHNVLLSIEGEVKLTDFGIARARDRLVRTTTGGTKGKLAYMAPEQAHGRDVDHRTDLFGVAATLYEALCGQPPFTGDNNFQILDRARAGAIVPLRERCPDLDPLLVGVIDRGLSLDPADRPQSAGEMRGPLEDVLDGHRGREEALAEVVRKLQAEEKALAAHNKRFAAVLLGSGTETGSVGVAAGTPTSPTLDSSPQVRDKLRTPRLSQMQPVAMPTAITPERTAGTVTVHKSRATVIALLLLAVGAAATFAIMKMQSGDSNEPVAATQDLEPTAGLLGASTAPLDAGTVASNDTTNSREAPMAPDAAPIVAKKPDPPPKTTKRDKKTRKSKDARKNKDRDKDTDREREVKYGAVSINSVPWAYISIDGKKLGKTPVKRHRLKVGSYKVTAKRPDGVTQTKRVAVTADGHARIGFHFQ